MGIGTWKTQFLRKGTQNLEIYVVIDKVEQLNLINILSLLQKQHFGRRSKINAHYSVNRTNDIISVSRATYWSSLQKCIMHAILSIVHIMSSPYFGRRGKII